jgi:arylsulfatase A-like enzyme
MRVRAKGSGRLGRVAASLLAAALVAACGGDAPHASRAPRHLVLVSIDTLRADHLGAYGYPGATSPRFDALAGRGVLFTHAVAQGPSTIPSHASLLTSVYHSAFVRPDRPMGPPASIPMLSEILRAQGFATAGFVDGGYLARTFGFGRGFEHYEDARWGLEPIVARVGRWLDAGVPERLFLFVHTYDVHTPYRVRGDVPPPFAGRRWRGRASVGARTLGRLEWAGRGRPPADLADLIGIYDAGIRHVDEWLGRLLDLLAARGILDDAVVVITSDHGEEFFEHGRTQHKQLYLAPNLHVPLLVLVPGRAPARVDETVELVDVVPTVLELLGLPPYDGAMGRSLVPLMDGRSRDGAGVAYSEGVVYSRTLRSAVSGRWQLLYDIRTGRHRLYDVEADPDARADRSADEPAVARRLLDVVRARMARAKARRVVPLDRAIPDATRRNLAELGYVEEVAPAR